MMEKEVEQKKSNLSRINKLKELYLNNTFLKLKRI